MLHWLSESIPDGFKSLNSHSLKSEQVNLVFTQDLWIIDLPQWVEATLCLIPLSNHCSLPNPRTLSSRRRGRCATASAASAGRALPRALARSRTRDPKTRSPSLLMGRLLQTCRVKQEFTWFGCWFLVKLIMFQICLYSNTPAWKTQIGVREVHFAKDANAHNAEISKSGQKEILESCRTKRWH